MITLHESTATSFTTLGIGALSDVLAGVVVEEINGEYELTFQYPTTGRRYNEILNRRIVMVKPNPHSSLQPFRMYSL